MSDTENIDSQENQFKRGDIVERNTWLEGALNAGHDLPAADVLIRDGAMNVHSLTLPEELPFIGNAGSVYTNVNGELMGSIVFGLDERLPNKLIVTDSGVLQQGKGHGRRLYLEALKALPPQYGMASHSMLSADGTEAWEWLVSAGVARRTDRKPEGQIGIYETVF